MGLREAANRLDRVRNHVFINLTIGELEGLLREVDAIGAALAVGKNSALRSKLLSEANALYGKVASYL
jgi:hypothetical protein